MNPPFIVRASVEHADSFASALDSVARERRYLLMVQAPPTDRVRSFVADIAHGGGVQFFAVDGDRVLGWCDITRSQTEGLRHVGHVGMGVIASHRRQGLGEALLRTALIDASRKGMTRIEMEVFRSDEAALALYAKLGFDFEGRKRRGRCLDGEYEDFVIMALLDPDPVELAAGLDELVGDLEQPEIPAASSNG